jgi:hypothetical protein
LAGLQARVQEKETTMRARTKFLPNGAILFGSFPEVSGFLQYLAYGVLYFPRFVNILATCWWLTPVILATQEAEIRRAKVESGPGK